MKRIKLLLAVVLVTIGIVGTSAFTSKAYHKTFTVRCFKYIGPAARTLAQVLTPSNYTPQNPLVCPTPPQIFCGICINDAVNPGYYDSQNNLPNFDNTDLSTTVQNNYTDNSKDGVTILGVEFHFEQQ